MKRLVLALIALVAISAPAFAIENVDDIASDNQCTGILQMGDGELSVINDDRRSEGVCLVAKPDTARILKACRLDRHCTITGTVRLCTDVGIDAGECVQSSNVTEVTDKRRADETYTYMCRVGKKAYPVKLTVESETMNGRTMTWRGQTFSNIKLTGNCRYEWTATKDDVTIRLCTATQGIADLTVNGATFDCDIIKASNK